MKRGAVKQRSWLSSGLAMLLTCGTLGGMLPPVGLITLMLLDPSPGGEGQAGFVAIPAWFAGLVSGIGFGLLLARNDRSLFDEPSEILVACLVCLALSVFGVIFFVGVAFGVERLLSA
jgi:hypothetical protein